MPLSQSITKDINQDNHLFTRGTKLAILILIFLFRTSEIYPTQKELFCSFYLSLRFCNLGGLPSPIQA
jgi:hypothetical protein